MKTKRLLAILLSVMLVVGLLAPLGAITAQAADFTYTYNVNGGSNPPSPQTKSDVSDLRITTAKPTWPNIFLPRTFVGWSLTSYSWSSPPSNMVADFQGNDLVPYNYYNSNMTLYAVWASGSNPSKYSVNFNANGGSLNGPSYLTKYYNVGMGIRQIPYTRNGYTFLGWSRYSSGVSSPEFPYGSAYRDNASTTLYAMWRYNVYLNYNDGTNRYYTMQKTQGAPIGIGFIPARTGYNFRGWSLYQGTGNPVYIGPGGGLTADGINFGNSVGGLGTQLFAVWEPIVVGSVSYDTFGGYGPAPISQQKLSDVPLQLSTVRPIHPYGYQFAGWTTDQSPAVQYQPGATYTVNAPLTLYAAWQFMVAFYPNYAGAPGPSSYGGTFTYRTPSFLISPPPLTRPGYTLLGWAGGPSATSPQYPAGTNIYAHYSAMFPAQLYAVWQENTTEATVTFVDYDGTTQTTRTQQVTIPELQGSVSIAAPAQNDRDGWTAAGWTTATAADAVPMDGPFTITGDTFIYGLYGRELTLDYKVGGVLQEDMRETGEQRVNSFDIAETADPAFTLPGYDHPQYDFEGWTDNISLDDYDAGELIRIARNTTLVARLNTRTHTVTYDYWTNGGQSATKSTDTVLEGRAIDLTPTAAKAGWVFVGWAEEDDATAALTSLNMGTTDVTLYAIFKPVLVTGVYFTLHDWLNNPPDARRYYWLEANILPGNATDKTLAWGTNPDPDPDNVLVLEDDGQGGHIRKVKVVNEGNDVYVTATTRNDPYTAYCRVESTTGGVKISFEQPTAVVEANAQLQLAADMIAEGAANGDVDWSSDNTKVATVDSTGLVQTLVNGKAMITGTIELDTSTTVTAEFAVVVGDGNEQGGDGGDDGGNNNGGASLKWWQKLPAWLQWILRIFFFGWIWMK